MGNKLCGTPRERRPRRRNYFRRKHVFNVKAKLSEITRELTRSNNKDKKKNLYSEVSTIKNKITLLIEKAENLPEKEYDEEIMNLNQLISILEIKRKNLSKGEIGSKITEKNKLSRKKTRLLPPERDIRKVIYESNIPYYEGSKSIRSLIAYSDPDNYIVLKEGKGAKIFTPDGELSEFKIGKSK